MNHMPCSLALTIMTFHASLSLLASSTSVTLPILSHFVSPSNIFSLRFPLLRLSLIIPIDKRFSIIPLLITWPKKVAWRLRILFMSILKFDVFGFCNTGSFHFFSVHEIRSILCKNQFLVYLF